MLVMRIARELGKYPHEIVEVYGMDQLILWAANFCLRSEDFGTLEKETDVESQLVNLLGQPKKT